MTRTFQKWKYNQHFVQSGIEIFIREDYDKVINKKLQIISFCQSEKSLKNLLAIQGYENHNFSR